MKNNLDKSQNIKELQTALDKLLELSIDYLVLTENKNESIVPKFKRPEQLTDFKTPISTRELVDKINNIFYLNPEILNKHPHFLAWSIGCGRETDIISGLTQSILNTPVQSNNQILGQIEKKTIQKILEYLHLTNDFDGLFVSGASIGNLLGISTGRMIFDRNSQNNIGLAKLVISDETHISVNRAALISGFNETNILKLQTNSKMIDHEGLNQLIDQKKLQNISTICATLGSTTLGKFDNLKSLHKICDKHKIWLHVDASWGAWYRILEEKRALTEGLEYADSISLDLHKWPGLPIGTALYLFNKKNENTVKDLFKLNAAYLEADNDQTFKFADYGIETTRPDRSLAPWALFQTTSLDQLKYELRYLCSISAYFSQQLKEKKGIIIVSQEGTNLVTFMYAENGKPRPDNDSLIKMAVERLTAKNYFIKTDCVENNLCIRISFMNIKIDHNDIDEMISII